MVWKDALQNPSSTTFDNISSITANNSLAESLNHIANFQQIKESMALTIFRDIAVGPKRAKKASKGNLSRPRNLVVKTQCQLLNQYTINRKQYAT